LENRVSLYLNSPNSQLIKDELFDFVTQDVESIFLRRFTPSLFKKVEHIVFIKTHDIALIKLCPALTKLELFFPSDKHNNEMDDRLFKTVANANVKLKHLTIKNAEIDGHGLAEIVDMPLESLTLRGFSLQDIGMPHISKITTLRKLDLSDTEITDKGLRELSNATHLKELSIGANDSITPEGIVDCLKNLSLNCLNMGWMSQIENSMENIIPSLLKMPIYIHWIYVDLK
ncbi:MAG: hypothetical protein H0U27_10575, partial [Nitrosopumilus sp.]|nr:hypothetical protein [Nitrosopumilus sp.]